MRIHDRIPTDALGGCCLITQKARLRPGERVLDTGIDAFDLPVSGGRLCITESGMLELMSLFEWERRTDDDRELRGANAELRAEISELRGHLRNILAAADEVDIDVEVPADVDVSELADA